MVYRAWLAASLLWACHSQTAPAGDDRARAAGSAKPPVVAKEEVNEGEQHADSTRALIGQRAPAATLPLLDGGQVALGDVLGKKPVYLKFWATWCVPCREQMPHFAAAYRKHGEQIAMYAVDLGVNDPIETVRAFQHEHALPMPIAIDADGALAERFHVAVTPLHILIDRSGVVRYVGHEATAAVDQALEALLADTPVPAPTQLARPPVDRDPALVLRDGTRFTMPSGKPVALTFVTTWCVGYLATSRPEMSQACKAHDEQVAAQQRSHPELAWITIAHPVWTSPADLDSFAAKLGIALKIGLDAQVSWFERYKVRDVTTTILIDRDGREVARVTGKGDALAAALDKLR